MPSPKARRLLGWFHRRTSVEDTKGKDSIIEEDDVEPMERPSLPTRVSHSTDMTSATGITVHYDIRRTVEDVREESTNSSSGDCITVIEEEKPKDDMV
jgi:hypothetical protein